MKLDDYRSSDNVEDQRDGGGGGGRSGDDHRPAYSGGGRSSSVRLTPTTFVIIVVLIAIGYFVNGRSGSSSAPSTSTSGSRPSTSSSTAKNDPSKVFVSKVLATTEDAWSERFRSELHKNYVPPRLVLFRDSVDSACGYESAAVGPFYCPRDKRAYLDLTFFDELRSRFGAPGDFAQAYVIAHEIGHHVQNLTGSSNVKATKGESGNSVRIELQADCFAGMWGAWAQKRGLLDDGDVSEALKAAKAIGDDTLQRRASGKVSPETFSHGSSAQRVKWFKVGMSATSLDDCDTFSASTL